MGSMPLSFTDWAESLSPSWDGEWAKHTQPKACRCSYDGCVAKGWKYWGLILKLWWWEVIDEAHGNRKRFYLEGGWDEGLKKQCSNNIQKALVLSFRLSILLRCVGTCTLWNDGDILEKIHIHPLNLNAKIIIGFEIDFQWEQEIS